MNRVIWAATAVAGFVMGWCQARIWQRRAQRRNDPHGYQS